MSETLTARIKVERKVWAEIKAEATRRDMSVKNYVGEILKKAVSDES